MIRVLLADDHPVVRSGFRRLLDQAGGIRVVAEAGDADSAFDAYVEHAPDVLLSDLTMPGGGGLALLQRVLEVAPQARVGVFSMHDSALLVRRVLQAGAAGFITKASPPPCLVDAVRSMHHGHRYLSPDLPTAWLYPDTDLGSDGIHSLSPRERQVFLLLAQGHSLAHCAQSLGLSAKTVANLQTEVKHKLGATTTAGLAHLALRHGLISDP